MHSQHPKSRRLAYLVRILVPIVLFAFLFGARGTLAAPFPQEPQGEVIGTIDGLSIAVKGPMSVQVVGNEVKTLLRSGVDIRVKSGRARIILTDGGTIAICGPAHISMLKAGNAITIALDSGTIHARIGGNLTLNVFTAQILAKTVAIADGPQDILAGFDAPGLMCVRAASGAMHLEEQFGGQSVMLPQGGDVVIANGQLQGLKTNTGLCACEGFEPPTTTGSNLNSTEISTLASREDFAKSATPRTPAAQKSAAPMAPDLPKPAAAEPTYQVYMPPLRYDATAKVQDEPDPKLIVLVRRVRVRPTLIFQSRVEGDPLPIAAKPGNATVTARAQSPDAKPNSAAPSVVDRVKSFFKSLWTPSS